MLSQLLISEIFAFLLVFCRLGSAIMLLPGFGEIYIPMRARLMMALAFSLILSPVITMPAVPTTVFGLIGLISAEILIGLFMGGLSRMLIAAVHMGGMIISYQSSLVSALVPDMAQAQGQSQGTVLGNLLSVTAVVLIFTTDLHHVMLKGLADSYSLFLPGQFPLVQDFADHATQTINSSFRMAMQMAAPHLVAGTLLYLAAGIIARLMPNIQIFFIMLPAQLMLSFFILMVAASAILMWYMDYFKDTLGGFLAP